MSSRENASLAAGSRHIAKMGRERGELFHTLWQQLAHIGTLWNDVECLYGSREKQNVLRSAAPEFFGRMLDCYWDSVLLGLCRVTDPAESKVMGVLVPNATFSRLLALLDEPFRGRVHSKILGAVAACDFARPVRNKFIGHLDLDLMTNPSRGEVTMGTPEQVRGAIQALQGVLAEIQAQYEDPKRPAHPFYPLDGEEVVQLLREGLATRSVDRPAASG